MWGQDPTRTRFYLQQWKSDRMKAWCKNWHSQQPAQQPSASETGFGCILVMHLRMSTEAGRSSTTGRPLLHFLHFVTWTQEVRLIRFGCAASISAGTAPAESSAPVGATFWQGVFSVLNILMGVGLLSIPLALSKSGWAGILVLWLLGFVTNYTGKVLVVSISDVLC